MARQTIRTATVEEALQKDARYLVDSYAGGTEHESHCGIVAFGSLTHLATVWDLSCAGRLRVLREQWPHKSKNQLLDLLNEPF